MSKVIKYQYSSGVYQILSKINGKFYIGSSVNLKQRKELHLIHLRGRVHSNKHLQRHYDKYGINDLLFIPIEYCPKEKLIIREQFYIDKLKPEFNILQKAYSTLGLIHSEESKKKSSESKRGEKNASYGIPKSEEQKQKISKKLKGRVFSKETRLKIGIKSKGRIVSKETRLKIGIAQKGRIPWNKGRKTPEEVKKKISESGKGKHFHSDEVKKKISTSLKGRVFTQEWKDKISIANRKKK